MKIGMYSVTYRGVWYKGAGLTLEQFLRLAKKQGWEGVEFDTDRPHAAPMDLSADDRKRLRELSGELAMPISAVSPNCDLSSPIPCKREAMLCYTRECIKLTRDLGAPICKIFAAWRGVTLQNGLASYDLAYGSDPYPFCKDQQWGLTVDSLRELCRVATDCGVVLALQNHGPDVVNNYREVLSLIREVGSPAFKACMDINIEELPESADHAKKMVADTGKLLVHSHANGEFRRGPDGVVELAGAGYWDAGFWGRKVAYPAYVDALVASGFQGYLDWEFCHPALENGKHVGIEYVHNQTALAHEYLMKLRADALAKAGKP
jgi:sugar phosphate isomerase/epimerase